MACPPGCAKPPKSITSPSTTNTEAPAAARAATSARVKAVDAPRASADAPVTARWDPEDTEAIASPPSPPPRRGRRGVDLSRGVRVYAQRTELLAFARLMSEMSSHDRRAR